VGEKYPVVAEALWPWPNLIVNKTRPSAAARVHRLTAAEALRQLRAQDFPEEVLPSLSTMAEVLNRNGYRLRPVVKAKPQKKLPETDAIFAHLAATDGKP